MVKEMTNQIDSYVCLVCGYIYDPNVEIPRLESCLVWGSMHYQMTGSPECGAGKDQFVKVDG